MAFEIGDVVTPDVNLVFQGLTFPTAGVSGTVSARQVVSAGTEDEEIIYDYQVQFPQPIVVEVEPENEEDDPEIFSADLFWFTSDDLGLDTGLTEGAPVDRPTVTANISAAQTTSSTAVDTISQVQNSLNTSDIVYDSVAVVSTIAGQNDTALQGADITNQPDSQAILQNQNADLLGNDQLLLQELAENFSELQAVLNENEAELKAAEDATEAANILGNQAAEQDQEAFTTQVLVNEANPNLFLPPSGQTPFEWPDESALEENIPSSDALISDFLTPEQQNTLVFNDE